MRELTVAAAVTVAGVAVALASYISARREAARQERRLRALRSLPPLPDEWSPKFERRGR